MSGLSVVLSASLERGLRTSYESFAVDVLTELSSAGVLNCSKEKALKLFNFEELSFTSKRSVAAKAKRAKELSGKTKKAKSSRTPKPEMILPFCGEIVADWCNAVRLNHGLHTQCTNGKVSGGDYCKTCTKAASNSATDKPPYGDIRERAACAVLSYRDPKGRQTTPYANVAEKLKLDLTKAQAVAAARGWQIPAEHLVKRSVKRGRPGKSAAVSDTESDSSKGSKKLKKKLKVKSAKKQSDLIAKLVAEAGEQLLGEVSGSESDSSVSSAASTASKAEKKAAKKAEKEAAKAAKLAEKEAAKAAKLAEKEAAKAAKLAEKEAAKAAKLAEKEAAKAAKLAEKEAAKAAKLAEKEAKKQAAEDAKAAKLAEKEAAKAAKLAEKEAKKQAAEDAKAAKLAEKEAKASAKAAKEAKLVSDLKDKLTKLNPELPILAAETTSKELRAEIKAEKQRIKEEKAAKQVAADEADAAEELDSTPVPSCEEESDEEAEVSVDVVEKEINGKTYLYDEAGGYAGVPAFAPYARGRSHRDLRRREREGHLPGLRDGVGELYIV